MNDELRRFSRTRHAVETFVDLQVTHCPVCDQSVVNRPKSDGNCFLCSQPLNGRDAAAAAGEERIRFEVAQLEGEQDEVNELIATVQAQYVYLFFSCGKLMNRLLKYEARWLRSDGR